jgi:hypothetical protein
METLLRGFQPYGIMILGFVIYITDTLLVPLDAKMETYRHTTGSKLKSYF